MKGDYTMNTDKIYAEAIANEYAPKDTSKVLALKKLDSPMHLICVHPERIDYLCSDFKKQGCSSRQTLIPD